MAYLPKSKIKIKTAQAGELVYVGDLSPFKGQYIESSGGRFYAGTNNLILGKELRYAPRTALLDGYGNADKTEDVQIHNVLNPKTNSFTINTIAIPGSKPQPTEKDYEKRYYPRYFTKRINNLEYKEISKDVYDSILNKSDDYDYHLNEVGKINWHLIGNVHKKNNTSIQIVSRTFPNLKTLFSNLSEYHRVDSTIETSQNNLYTAGKELYYGDGKEYIGPYHIHPEKGPMVGAEHLSIPHDKLYYPNQLSNKITLDIFNPTKPTTSKPGLDKPTISTNDRIVRSPSTPSPPPSIPSNGGSGY